MIRLQLNISPAKCSRVSLCTMFLSRWSSNTVKLVVNGKWAKYRKRSRNSSVITYRSNSTIRPPMTSGLYSSEPNSWVRHFAFIECRKTGCPSSADKINSYERKRENKTKIEASVLSITITEIILSRKRQIATCVFSTNYILLTLVKIVGFFIVASSWATAKVRAQHSSAGLVVTGQFIYISDHWLIINFTDFSQLRNVVERIQKKSDWISRFFHLKYQTSTRRLKPHSIHNNLNRLHDGNIFATQCFSRSRNISNWFFIITPERRFESVFFSLFEIWNEDKSN